MSELDVLIAEPKLRAYAAAIVRAAGSAVAEAEKVAAQLVEANLRGHDSHGAGMLPAYIKNLRNGTLKPNEPGKVVRDDGAFIVYDGLRGYGQHDPLVEYKRESFDMFEAMMQRFQEDTVRYLYLMQILERPADPNAAAPQGAQPQPEQAPTQQGTDGNGRRPRMVSTSADELEEAFMRRKRRELEQARMAGAGDVQPVQQVVRGQEKVGRNDPCPCGSGKKFKKCHRA